MVWFIEVVPLWLFSLFPSLCLKLFMFTCVMLEFTGSLESKLIVLSLKGQCFWPFLKSSILASVTTANWVELFCYSWVELLASPSAVALGQLVRSGSGKMASLRGCRGLRLCSVSQKWKGKSRFHISLISQQVCYLGYVCAQGAARAVFLSFLWSPLWQLRTK